MCDKPIKEFSKSIIRLFDILTMKATTSTQKAGVDRLRRLYSAYKEQVSVEAIIKDMTPLLIKKRSAILNKEAELFTSAVTRQELVAKASEEVIINMYDFCVEAYKSCSDEERAEIWRIVLAIYTSCLACAAYWSGNV